MVELTTKEKELLKQIVGDKFSNGAFAGMVFNAVVQYRLNAKPEDKESFNELLDKLIKSALATRVRLEELSK